jgi:hypothetical protein
VTTPHLAGQPAASQQAIVDAALLMLQQMGLSPDDLVTAPKDRPPVPTFAEYVPVVSAAVTGGTRRAHGSYWNRVVDHWGERRLDEIAPSEIRAGESARVRAKLAARSRRARSSSRGVRAVTSWSRIGGGQCGAVVQLGADSGEFALDVGADRRVGAQSLEAPGELVAVVVELPGGELADRTALLVTHR